MSSEEELQDQVVDDSEKTTSRKEDENSNDTNDQHKEPSNIEKTEKKDKKKDKKKKKEKKESHESSKEEKKESETTEEDKKGKKNDETSGSDRREKFTWEDEDNQHKIRLSQYSENLDRPMSPFSHSKKPACIIFSGLALRSLGVIYGDIGTSPLYVFNSIFNSTAPSDPQEFINSCSLVIWSLFILVTFKYVTFLLLASNKGEGGIFALGSLLTSKKSRITSKRSKRIINVFMVVGASLILADGAFTPAVSVLSAIEGLNVAFNPTPASSNSTSNSTVTPPSSGVDISQYIVVITLVILLILFLCQPFGTSKIGIAFGPIMLIWFATLFALGIYRIIEEPSCLYAFNPVLGYRYLYDYGGEGYIQLGAVFLAVTGLEALYADLGHFTAGPIRASWLIVVLPALLANYVGQAGLLYNNPQFIVNPFYYMAPPILYWPLIILATLATIIASQAIITGSFSLASQAVNLGFAPPLTIKHTSKGIAGQIFVPFFNYLLMVLTLLITYGFGTNGNITNAYGFTVCTMMIVTTVFYSIVIYAYFKLSIFFSVLFMLFFLVDASFWGATIFKVPQGGWVAILIALVLSFSMLTWMAGEYYLSKYLKNHYVGIPIGELSEMLNNPVQRSLNEDEVDEVLEKRMLMLDSPVLNINVGSRVVSATRVPGCGVFITDTLEFVPKSFDMFIEKSRGVPQIIIFLKVNKRYYPTIPHQKRYTIESYPCNIFAMSVSVGYAENNIPLIELVKDALYDITTTDLEITVYQATQNVQIVSKGCIAFPLSVYAGFKEFFPTGLNGVVVDPDNKVIIHYVCPL